MAEQSPSKPVIGIVGGIGAGKSVAAAEFARLGCLLVDADAIGHQLLSLSDVRAQVRARWGAAAFAAGGQVDRQALGRIVFGDPEELAALNRILHPRIRARMVRQIKAARRDPAVPAVVVDAAVLFEACWDDLCTHTVFVSAPLRQRVRRVRVSKGWDRQTMLLREKSQISLDKKAGKCDSTIDNSSSVSHLREQVRKVFQETVHAADRP